MKLFGRDLRSNVAIVAEIGNNHEGSYSRAEELIGRAAQAGVDAVKFQTFVSEHYINREDTERLSRLRKFVLSFDQFRRLAHLAGKLGVTFFSTPFDLESANALNELCPVIKISSGDNTFFALLERVASFRKPILLSTGLANVKDIEQSFAAIKRVWQTQGHRGEIVLMHCVSSYPTPLAEANLAAIRTLATHFGEAVGYSDHTLGIDAAVLSVALGARVIEKHFTLDKNQSEFRDHQLSSEPTEMQALVEAVRRAVALIGNGEKSPQACELGNSVAMRRSVAAGMDLPAGTVLEWNHLTWVRPGIGFAPDNEAQVLGRKLARPIRKGEILRLDHLTEPGGVLQ